MHAKVKVKWGFCINNNKEIVDAFVVVNLEGCVCVFVRTQVVLFCMYLYMRGCAGPRTLYTPPPCNGEELFPTE